MAARSVITVTTGEAGSGKSYARCARFLVDRFLADSDGVHWSNFPLGLVPEDHAFPPEYDGETFVERIASAAASMHKLDAREVEERVQVIPKDVLDAWERGESGPWEFFEGKRLQDAHIAIDEIHNFVDPQGRGEFRKRWRQWLGEIRHQGATVEFLSQSLQKIPLEIRREAGLHIEVKNTETERDPFCRVALSDWYELRAGFVTGRYRSNVLERERRSAMGDPGRAAWTESRIWPIDPWYFRFYDSFSAPQKGGEKGRAQAHQFERRSRLGLLGWFLGSNAHRLLPRAALVAGVVWLFAGHLVGLGGGRWVAHRLMAKMQGIGGQAPESASKAAGAPPAELVDAEKPAGEAVGTEAGVRLAEVVLGLRGAVVELNAALELERVAREAAEKERGELAALLEARGELSAVGRGFVVLRGGSEYRVGERIEGGPYDGKRVLSVDFRRRSVRLDDGTVLRLGLRALDDDSGGGLSAFLPGS